MTQPTYHPGEDLLRDYADGSLAEPPALVIATHLAFCPRCRIAVAEQEAIGGALLDEEALNPVSADCLEAVLARLDEPEPPATIPEAPPPALQPPPPTDPVRVPEPLRSYLGAPLESLSWHPVVRGIDEVDLRVGRAPVRTRLVRIRAGASVPRHSHCGHEMNLVLSGGFRDERGAFGRGDVVIDDASVDHRPVADPGGDCICLTVTDAPLRLTGGLGRILNPFLRF